jgi:hypothetical protein
MSNEDINTTSDSSVQHDREIMRETQMHFAEADETVEQREAPPDWAFLAVQLRGVAVDAVAAYYALCNDEPVAAVAALHGTRDKTPGLYHAILDKMEELKPGSAATFYTPQDSDAWRNPYWQEHEAH